MKKDFSYTECRLLINIILSTNERYLTQASLARNINIAPSSPTYINIYKYLVENNIITLHDTIGSSKIIEVNEKALRDLIDNQEVVELIFEYLKNYHFAGW